MKSFGENLKLHRKALGLSQKVLGELIGLKQTTIANYENDIRFPKGDNLKKLAYHLNLSIDGLLNNYIDNPSLENIGEIYSLAQKKLITALIDWDERKAIEIISGLEPNHSSVMNLYEKVIKVTMYEIGQLWEGGNLSVIQEHFASGVCFKVVVMLSQYCNFNSEFKGSTICMTVNPEEHNIGIRMISETFRVCGYKNFYIGTKVPTNQLKEAILNNRIDYLALSISLTRHFDSMENLIELLRSDERLKDLKIIVGGKAFLDEPELIQQTKADTYIEDCYGLIEMLN